jgi:hypothetical protein
MPHIKPSVHNVDDVLLAAAKQYLGFASEAEIARLSLT